MTRPKFPNRRQSYNLSFTHGKFQYDCSYSIDLRFGLFEVFMQGGKPGSELEAMARDAAVVTSLALQYGCPLETIQSALTKGELNQPAGPLGVLIDTILVDFDNYIEKLKAQDDMILFGSGFLHVTEDGKYKHIDPKDVFLKPEENEE